MAEIPGLAAELVRLNVDLIVSASAPVARVMRAFSAAGVEMARA
jgi:hypothetical protein